MPDTRLRAALIGCGVRGTTVYLPVLRAMSRHFTLTAVCDERADRAAAAAAACGATAFTDLDRLLDEGKPDVAVICVTPPPSDRNAIVAARCLEAGVPVLAETPLGRTLAEAGALLALAQARGLVAESAENYSRTPWERFKRVLIDAGVFGAVHVVYSDFVGHGYHGVSVIRGHVGFDAPAVRVIGLAQDYPVAGHEYRQGEWRDRETWQFGTVEFAGGARGVLSFSTLSYGSPLRWGRSKCAVRFLAERGMGAAQDLAVLSADRAGTRPLNVTPRTVVVDGRETLAAWTTDLPGAPAWENPLRCYPLIAGDQHDEITVGLELFSVYNAIVHGAAPEYPFERAYVDRAIDLAISESAARGGAAVEVPAPPAAAAR